jgi:protein-S-isoprenylcysteine O-methyltransferase Ste14
MKPIIYLSFAFAISELILMIVKRSKTRTVKRRKDSGSLILLWIIITIGFTGGFFLAKSTSQFWLGFGFSLIICGLIMRWVSIIQLGKSFTVDVAITVPANLKTDGIFERIRHPGYTGLLLIVVGFSAVMSSFYSFLALAVPVFLQ